MQVSTTDVHTTDVAKLAADKGVGGVWSMIAPTKARLGYL